MLLQVFLITNGRDDVLEAPSARLWQSNRSRIQTKALLAGALLCALVPLVQAKPSQRIVDACVSTESTTPSVKYAEIENHGFSVEGDEDAKKTSITMGKGKNVVGVWEVKSPKAFGLAYKGKEIDVKRVARLDPRHAPAEFDMYKAVWGEAREGASAYLCATFNFDGLGQSGTYQNVRGVYLIDKKARMFKPFYAVGDIKSVDK